MRNPIGYRSDNVSGTLQNTIRAMRAAIKLAETANTLYCSPVDPSVCKHMMLEAVEQSRRGADALEGIFNTCYK